MGTEGVLVHNSCRRFDVASIFNSGANKATLRIRWWSLTTLKWQRNPITGKISFGDRSQLANVLGTSNNIEAHHIIAWAEGDHLVIQVAALDGFHLNDYLNGIGLEKFSRVLGTGVHGSHRAYNDYIKEMLNRWSIANVGFTPARANSYLGQVLIPDLTAKIFEAKNSSLSLNEYFKTVVNINARIPGY